MQPRPICRVESDEWMRASVLKINRAILGSRWYAELSHQRLLH